MDKVLLVDMHRMQVFVNDKFFFRAKSSAVTNSSILSEVLIFPLPFQLSRDLSHSSNQIYDSTFQSGQAFNVSGFRAKETSGMHEYFQFMKVGRGECFCTLIFFK